MKVGLFIYQEDIMSDKKTKSFHAILLNELKDHKDNEKTIKKEYFNVLMAAKDSIKKNIDKEFPKKQTSLHLVCFVFLFLEDFFDFFEGVFTKKEMLEMLTFFRDLLQTRINRLELRQDDKK